MDYIRDNNLPVEVIKREGVPKLRKVWDVNGFGGDLDWGVHNNSTQNLLRGLVERVYRVQGQEGLCAPPRPSANAYARLKEFQSALKRWLPRAAPVDYDTFVEYYRGRKRTIYRNAADSLMAVPLRAADAHVRTFVKAEKINRTKKPDPAPRLIQPRHPRYNVEVGRFLRPLEKLVYRAIGKVWRGPTVLKGMNANQQAEALWDMWVEFDNPVAVGLDASRFDQHVSVAALRWEHSVYLSCFGREDARELGKLLDMQIHNVGKAITDTHKIKYRVDGCRMSGDINTSLGNCLIMCALVWEWARSTGVRCRLANNGDDCVVIMSKRDLDRFMLGLPEWFRDMGFTMEVEAPEYDFERIVFCQMQPVRAPTGWIMTRQPDISVRKDLTSLLALDTGWSAYCGAIGQCGHATYGDLPVLGEFYKSLTRVGKVSKLDVHNTVGTGLFYLSQGMKSNGGPVCSYTRYSFALAFGILPDEQEALEAWLQANPVPQAPPISVTPGINVWYK